MHSHPAVVCSTIRKVLLGCVRACVLVCEWLRAEGGFIRVMLGRGGPRAQGYQKAFHCSVVEVAVLCSKHFCMWCHEATN